MKKIMKALVMALMLTLVVFAFTGCLGDMADRVNNLRCELFGHSIVLYADEYYCEEEGLSAGAICEVCGYVERQRFPLEATGHDFADATCLEAKVCKTCGKVEGEALGHDEKVIPAVEATCLQGGMSEGVECARCEEVLLEPVATDIGDHRYGEPDENGTKVCSDCKLVLVSTQAGLQAALDNAVKGTTIVLTENVNYGVVYLRPSKNEGVTKVVDWVGNNYRYETYSLFEDLTILGAEGATVDAIKIEGGTYYNTEHSQSAEYPIMLSLIELRNVLIEGVTFTGKGGYDPQGHGNVINLSGHNIKVDGLTLKDCVLENPSNNARLLYKTESTTHEHKYVLGEETYTFVPSLANISIVGCTLNGGYMGLELRETTNVTIVGNTFNVGDRNMLLAVNTGCTYSGTITISDNISNNAQERFVRANGIGDAKLIITNNTINNYKGADLDYIKATGVTGESVVENNTITDGSDEGNREFTVIVQ